MLRRKGFLTSNIGSILAGAIVRSIFSRTLLQLATASFVLVVSRIGLERGRSMFLTKETTNLRLKGETAV